jgi:hypothetical protein
MSTLFRAGNFGPAAKEDHMFNIHNVRLAAFMGGITTLAAGVAVGMPPTGDWNAPANLETLPQSSPNINTPAVDGCASLSPDGLSIAFNSNRTGNHDIYIATRPNKSVGFGSPLALPAPINSAADDSCPTLTEGNRLYFSSNREDPAYDIYVTRRVGYGWSTPARLGPNINTPGRLDESAALYVLSGHEFLLFSSRNIDGTAGVIYQSVDGGPKSPVQGGPNLAGSNNRPSISHDGKTIFFDSDRPGTLGGPDLYYASRAGAVGPFGSATHLQSLSSPAFDARPFVSWDGTLLTFASARTGSTSPAPDIWFATR